MPKILLIAATVALMLSACSKADADRNAMRDTQKQKVTTLNASAPKLIPAPDTEPSEAVLRKLQFQENDEIEKAGGLPLTVTASGKSFTLRIKLLDVHKEKSCDPTPQAEKGWFECHLILTSSWSTNGGVSYDKPSDKPARFGVKWDGKLGEWVRQ